MDEVEINQLIPVKFEKVMQSRTYTCIVLTAEEKKFAIYTSLDSGKAMHEYLTQTKKARPSTHDFLNQIFRGLEISVKQIVINELHDTIYHARIFLEQRRGDILHIVEIDARPSDCITLALIHKVPLFCTPQVLKTTIALEEPKV